MLNLKLFKEKHTGPTKYRENQSFPKQKTLKEIQDEIQENNTIFDLCAFFDSERDDYTTEIDINNKYLIIYNKSHPESIPDMEILEDSVTLPRLHIKSLIKMYDSKCDHLDFPKFPISFTRIEERRISNCPIGKAVKYLSENESFCILEDLLIPENKEYLKDRPLFFDHGYEINFRSVLKLMTGGYD